MALSVGTKLGPYEIVGPLGSGGMGEVYRARDTRLGRDVAVKVLPQHLSANAEMRARFEREARAVSSLNHPHICTLHDVGREGDTDYLVMELIEGVTLADRLARGPLPVSEVLELGAQIADALDRAHRAGVLHRDLKPGNVMLTRSGAKLMDFGLARPAELGGPASASGLTALPLAESPTVAKPLTTEGTLVGTFHYMAPEQLEGKKSDARADLWALGCVLYEMATGRRAFDGQSQASLIGSIMSGTPPPISLVATLAPPALEQVVHACLTKDPDERIQTAHDVKLQLEWIRAARASQAGVPAPPVARPWRRESLAWLLAAVGLALGVGSLYLQLSRHRELEPILASVEPGVKDVPLYASAVRLSPDGKNIAFIGGDTAGSGIWIRALGSDRPRLLPGTEDVDLAMFWAPDGRQLAYGTRGKLKKVAIDGGSPVTVCDLEWSRGGSWGTGGQIVFSAAPEGPLYRVSEDGGQPTPVTSLDPARGEKGHRFPSFLPDGKHFLFVTLPGRPEGYDTFVGSLDGGPAKLVLTAASAAVYAEPGFLLFAREGKIVAQRFDTERLALEGTPVVLGNSPPKTSVDAEPVASASRDLRLLFLHRSVPETHLEWIDRNGSTLGVVALPPGPWRVMRLSPDERKAALINDTDVWVVDLVRAIPTRFARTTTGELTLAWLHDSRRAAFVSNVSGRAEIYVGSIDGGDPQRIPTTDDQFKLCEDVTPDDLTLVFSTLAEATSWDLWTVPLAGGKAEPYLATPAVESNAAVSPDGRWLAYESNESGQSEIYIQSFPQPGRKVRVSVDGGSGPRWTRGGKELTYFTVQGVVAVAIDAGTEIEPGIPRLLHGPLEGVTGGDVAADGSRFLVSRGPRAEPDFRLILDWTALARR